MMVEEPSVVAAASYGAKLVNQTGGFKTIKSERLMIGQIVFDDVKDTEDLTQRIQNKKTKLNVLQMKPILLSSVVGWLSWY